MSTQNSKKSFRERLRNFVGDRRAVSPAPSVTQSTAVQSSNSEDLAHRTKAASSTTDAPSPPSNLHLADSRATLVSKDEAPSDIQEPATPSPPEKTPEPADEPKESNSAISQRLWNAAYESLENEEQELVGSYLKTLEIRSPFRSF